ncbi:MAG: helix-turn-helix domain-containing protein [Kutzneria sp.]|nr:helix-turn-helix domain-containing protein [Kutzneria sp.]MBV9846109.1 helix-turn-helix domain-containing protein [Kutzneria sp.]
MPEDSEQRYLTTAEVAHRLGVKPETVYTYVSRGLLRRVPAKGRRRSLFALTEVDRLAARGSESHAPSGAVERIRSTLTLIDEDELYYRGHRVSELVPEHTVESVAHLLWTGKLTEQPRFPAPEKLVELVRSAATVLPSTARLSDRLRVAVAVLGAADPLRFDLTPDAVVHAARSLIGVLVDALPGPSVDGTLGARLWPKLSTLPARPDLLDTALVLLADHGLAVSTVAARVAASARACVYSVVSAGLGAADGHYHGAASTLAYRFLGAALHDPLAALSEHLRGGNVPGYGHRVYRHRDPRAEHLLRMLPRTPVVAAVDAVCTELDRRRGEAFPNVDLALAALAHTCGMGPDTGEAIFSIARVVGWTAHALEEYAEPALRFRPVGVYAGRAGRDRLDS